MFFKELKSYNSGLQKLVSFTVFYILITIILILIKIFNINIHRYDPHDPKVLIFEFLPIIIFSLITLIIGIKIFRKIKNKKYIIPIFFLSQALFGMTFTIFFEIKTLKIFIISLSIIIFVSSIQYLFIKIYQKEGLDYINYSEKNNNEEKIL
jgi:hypothetical protein